ncbi:peptidoglycan glycosyltransferase OS=Streptomyces tendae OX=1932 GN=GUR47_21135 PE=4 SV=1 [Streptomyces tendae]
MKWGVRDPDLGEVQAQDERTVVSPKSLYSGKNNLKINNYDGSIWENEKGEQWRQENDGKDNVGSPPDYKIDLREAMRESVNSAFVQLGMDVGLHKVKEAAVDAGLLEDSLAVRSPAADRRPTRAPSAWRARTPPSRTAASSVSRTPSRR